MALMKSEGESRNVKVNLKRSVPGSIYYGLKCKAYNVKQKLYVH